MSVIRRAGSIVPRRWRQAMHTHRIRINTRHLCGPRQTTFNPHSFVVTCLVKNGAYYVDAFVQHYTSLGASHIVVMDNGSTDDTVERFAAYDCVSVYRCELPVGRYQRLIKRTLATQHVPGGWCLDVDIDELFGYPFVGQMALSDFIGYLDEREFDAVVTQMVDMYSSDPIHRLADPEPSVLNVDDYPFYDLRKVTHERYDSATIVRDHAARNRTSDLDPGINWGGVRQRLFGLRCLLTKHSLFRVDRGLSLFTHPHFCDGATLADVSAVLRHYKLVGNCYETSRLNREAFMTTRQGYADLLQLIEREPDRLIFDTDASTRFNSAEGLLDSGFVVASSSYRKAFGNA